MSVWKSYSKYCKNNEILICLSINRTIACFNYEEENVTVVITKYKRGGYYELEYEGGGNYDISNGRNNGCSNTICNK